MWDLGGISVLVTGLGCIVYPFYAWLFGSADINPQHKSVENSVSAHNPSKLLLLFLCIPGIVDVIMGIKILLSS